MNIKALLIQIRQNKEVLEEERESFAEAAKIAVEQIHTFNVFDHPSFDIHLLQNYDFAFVGGASEASVLKPNHYSFVNPLIKLMGECIEQKYPVFASCFGFQAAVLALGGEIIRDEENFEMGTYQMKLTDKADEDPIFRGIPNKFYGISVHQEKCVKIPPGADLLAKTDDCIHAFKAIDAPFWAFQFHPELTRPKLITRLKAYQDQYADDDNHYQQVIDSLQDTPAANKLVQNFVEYIKNTKTP